MSHDEERGQHIGQVQDSFLGGLIKALQDEQEAILSCLSNDELPPQSTRYVREGSWTLIEAGASIERQRLTLLEARLEDYRERYGP